MIELLIVLALIFVITGLGRFIQEKVYPAQDPLADLLLSFALGSSALILILFIFGWVGLFSPLPILLMLAVFGVLAGIKSGWMYAACKMAGVKALRQNLQNILISIILGIFLLINLVGALSPTTDSDGLGYHLAVPKVYLQAGSFVYHPMITFTWPLSGEMLMVPGLVLSGDIAAKLIHFACGLAAAFAVFLIGRRLFDSQVGFWAAAIFYTIPLISIESGIAYNDLFLAFFFLIGIYVWLDWLDAKEPISLLVSGGLLGVAASMKWNAPLFVVMIAALSAFFLYRQEILKKNLKYLALFIILSAIFPCLWYAKNAMINGNPFGPFVEGTFDGRDWTPENTVAYRASVESVDRSVMHLLTAPFLLFIDGARYGELTFFGPILLMLFPLFLFRSKDLRSRHLLALCIFTYLMWFLTSQQSRLLLPIVGVMAVLCASVFRVERRIALHQFIAVMVLASMLLNLAFPMGYHLKGLPVVLGLESVDEYKERIRPVYPAFRYINGNLPQGSRLAMIGEIHAYWSDVPFVYECAAMQGILRYETSTAQEIYDAMKGQGITHLLLNHRVPFCPTLDKKLREEPFLSKVHVMYSANDAEVLKLD